MVADRRARETWPTGPPQAPPPWRGPAESPPPRRGPSETRQSWQAPGGPQGPGAWPPRRPDPNVGTPQATKRKRRADASPWNWLLLIPIVVPLLPPLYNRMEPTLLGLPFFYWCQLAFAGLAAVTTVIVHIATKDRR